MWSETWTRYPTICATRYMYVSCLSLSPVYLLPHVTCFSGWKKISSGWILKRYVSSPTIIPR
jgi:hypothetical protein